MSGLTAKQEAFVQAYLKVGNQRQAYRAAYNAENMSDAVVDVKACELMKNGKVKVRIAEMQERTAKRTEVTVETINKMLVETFQAARNDGNHPACVSAAMGMAKLHGLITDKSKTTHDVTDNLADLMREINATSTTVFPFATDETDDRPADLH